MKKILFWILAVIITLATLYYQRKTGPTQAIMGKIPVDNTEVKYRLARAHGGEKDHTIALKAPNTDIGGYVTYKRYKTSDDWTQIQMSRKEESLTAKLPHQPPAGKLMYRVILTYQEKEISLTGDKPVIIRFRGDVPAPVLILHIIVIFAAMLVSTRAGFETFDAEGKHKKYAILVIALLFVGGLILGPLMQKFAFGAWWTGFPLGKDLTDTKTLVAFIAWIVALAVAGKKKHARWWYLGAAILTLIIFLIPHSLLGSELDYSQLNMQ